MSARNRGGFSDAVTAAIVGAVVGLIVREVGAFGIDLQRWSLHVPRALESVEAGAIVSTVSHLFGQWRASR